MENDLVNGVLLLTYPPLLFIYTECVIFLAYVISFNQWVLWNGFFVTENIS